MWDWPSTKSTACELKLQDFAAPALSIVRHAGRDVTSMLLQEPSWSHMQFGQVRWNMTSANSEDGDFVKLQQHPLPEKVLQQ